MALAQQNADPEIDFRRPYWNPISGEVKYFIRRFAALHRPTTQGVLRDPWHTTNTDTTNTTDTPFAIPHWSIPHIETKLES